MAKKSFIIEKLRIERVAAEGKTIGYFDGKVVFVEGVAPGDLLDVEVYRKKKKYLDARVLHVLEKSVQRAEPFCVHYNLCGGCKWQHLQYDEQLKHKHQQVLDSFERIAKVGIENIGKIEPSLQTTHYRNKLEFTFSDKKWLTTEEINITVEIDRRGLGFHMPGHFDKVIDVTECHLQADPSNAIRNNLREFVLANDLPFYNIKDHTGFLRNLIIRSNRKGEIMVVLQVAAGNETDAEKILDHLSKKFDAIKSTYYIVNTKKNDSFFDLDPVHHGGDTFIFESIDKLIFKIGPKSFFQTNPSQAEKLYAHTIKMAKLSGQERVYDLYTGTGTIALMAAINGAKQVIGIENVAAAIEDAKENAIDNQISNATFYAGDTRDLFNQAMFAKEGRPDVLITDPPRAGMHPDVIRTILDAEPDRIIYVSCNPASQARDVALLSLKYKVEAIQPVDMFPHTHHVENIAALTKINS